MISCFVRLATFPVALALYVLLWCGMCVLHYLRMLCRFIVRTIFLLVTIGFVTGLEDGVQLTKMLIVSFAIFLIPQIGGITVDILMHILKGYQYLFQHKSHRIKETYGNHQNMV